jgi:DNA uptake protein ComE-like DNA-binding protein
MSGKKNINKAFKEDLMKESDELAKRIVSYIDQKGGIKNIEELNEVNNIEPRTIASIQKKFTAK